MRKTFDEATAGSTPNTGHNRVSEKFRENYDAIFRKKNCAEEYRESIYEAGRKAHAEGLELEDNPHLHDPDREIWAGGYRAARDAARRDKAGS